ncbi:MAG: DKNYY domain-containing protein, partial [Clostridiales bacterium]|nr:DKNYY domain-containing protein [Clostridiales bacterium]
DNEYAKDKKNVYYKENVLNEADPKSFKSLSKISSGLGKDKNNLYFFEDKVNNIDVKTLEIMTDEFSIYLKVLQIAFFLKKNNHNNVSHLHIL